MRETILAGRKKPKVVLPDDTIGWLALAATALGEEMRLKILRALLEAGRPLTVSELADQMEIRQPTVSHHLTKLRECGLITRKQKGVWANVAINPAAFRKLADVLVQIADAAPDNPDVNPGR
jgi:DNA-binding transcriptional ArsR family regulator